MIADRPAREYPEANKGSGVIVEPIRAGIVGSDLQTTSVFLLGVVGFVLLLCCANVADLLLARASARAGGIAVRSALGAERGRMVRQLLRRAWCSPSSAGRSARRRRRDFRGGPGADSAGPVPGGGDAALNARVVMFGLAAALAVGVVFGLIPAWPATGTSIAGVMGSESRSATSAGGRIRSLLVAGEVAAAVLLLCGAGLLLQTLLTLVGGDPGYRSTPTRC